MRYFIKLQYLGTHFVGWQIQPEGDTVQGKIEESLSYFFKTKVPITGCGRTDTGVHASCYYAHFDAEIEDATYFLYKINRMVGPEISIEELIPVKDDLHARYSANERRYHYYLSTKKDPFKPFTQYHYPFNASLDIDLLNQAAALIAKSKSFEAFCKTGSDVNNFLCSVYDCSWLKEGSNYTFTISANRFLRGMVRLIVGACLNVAYGKVTLDKLTDSLKTGKRLDLNWSVPAHGLFLSDVRYPELDSKD